VLAPDHDAVSTQQARKNAFVTGASRGIGKAIAVALAGAGFDVAITARTVEPGEEREHSPTATRSDRSPLPGSLRETAAAIEQAGATALMVPADLLDRASLGAAATTVLERWGTVDVVVHNARYIGPGHMDRLMETPVDLLDQHLEGNVMAPIILTKLVLPQMIQRGSGVVMTITSGAGRGDPPAAAGEGGWGLGYGMSKGAVHRLVGIVKLEHERDGILAFNLHPGFVTTERMIQDMGAFGFDADAGAPADVIGAAAAWLCTAPEARDLNGEWIEGQELTAERGLLPGWSSPSPVSVPPTDGSG
jgi:NAD(P)-dependent dehydrogenase (short-subunit alcohol dehydrogenase family)